MNSTSPMSGAPHLVVYCTPADKQPADAQADIWCLTRLSLSTYVHHVRSLGSGYHGVHFDARFPEWTLWDPHNSSSLHSQHQQEHGLSIIICSERLCQMSSLTTQYRSVLETNGLLGGHGALDQNGPLSCQLTATEFRRICQWPKGFALCLTRDENDNHILMANACVEGVAECFVLCRAIFGFLLNYGISAESITIALCIHGQLHEERERVASLLKNQKLLHNCSKTLHTSLPPFQVIVDDKTQQVWLSISSSHCQTILPKSGASVTLQNRQEVARQSGWYIM